MRARGRSSGIAQGGSNAVRRLQQQQPLPPPLLPQLNQRRQRDGRPKQHVSPARAPGRGARRAGVVAATRPRQREVVQRAPCARFCALRGPHRSAPQRARTA
jgi:hypothetical protein